MVRLQPYNQGEYICDAYVIIDEENATAHVRKIDHGNQLRYSKSEPGRRYPIHPQD